MLEPVSKASVHAFYADAIRHGRNTAENLQAPTSERFNTVLSSIEDQTPRTALDLGYGAGNYTLALARAGFRVVAVDQVPCTSLLGRIGGEGEWARRIEARQRLAEDFVIDEDFGVFVARDVLHYLAQRDVESLLTRAVAQALGANRHYLEVFTDIARRSSSGQQIRIEGEAGYSPDAFRRVVEEIYDRWDVAIHWSDHAEQDTRTGRTCFEATRATVIAAKPAA